MSKSKKPLTINLSRTEVMAHEIGPIILATAKQCQLDLKCFGHGGTTYRKNPYKDRVDYIDSRFYNSEDNIELHTTFVDEGQQDLWELRETVLDKFITEDGE